MMKDGRWRAIRRPRFFWMTWCDASSRRMVLISFYTDTDTDVAILVALLIILFFVQHLSEKLLETRHYYNA